MDYDQKDLFGFVFAACLLAIAVARLVEKFLN